MCIGMANGGKEPEFINEKSRVDDLGRIQIPRKMRKKLGINEGDILQLTATGNVIVIEREEKQND